MSREVGDERSRYGRKSLRDRLEDAAAWPREHLAATGIALVVIVGALLLAVARGQLVSPADLRTGDCLFVRTGTATLGEGQVGDPRAVADAVMQGRVERAGCDASHGHEVSLVVPLSSVDFPATDAQVRCDAEFEAYVGRPADGSRYVTFPAVPTAQQQADGAALAVCLVGRRDGGWLDHPARASAE